MPTTDDLVRWALEQAAMLDKDMTQVQMGGRLYQGPRRS